MSDKPLVTILITTYNTNPIFLNESVKSAIDQDYPNLEVLIIDDGSKPRLDQNLDFLNHPNLRYVYMEHQGLPFGLIRGIQESKGKYIAILDHDDVLTEESIKTRAQTLNNENAGLVYGDINYCDSEGKVYSTQRFKSYSTINDLIAAIITSPIGPLKHSGIMFSRDAVVNVGNYDPNLPIAFDSDLIIRVAKEYGWYHIPEVVVNYRTHRTNAILTLKHRTKGLKYVWKLTDKYVDSPSRKLRFMSKRVIIDIAKTLYELFSPKKHQVVFDTFDFTSSISIHNFIYVKKSLGKDHRPINIYKIRTMYLNAEDELSYILNKKHDQYGKPVEEHRITKLGIFLRKYFIDEIPQFYNWLRRDIGLVGIRPMEEEYWKKKYPQKLMEEALKHKPGWVGFQYAFTEKDDFDLHIKNMWQYLNEKREKPIHTDIKYFFKVVFNILFRNTRGS